MLPGFPTPLSGMKILDWGFGDDHLHSLFDADPDCLFHRSILVSLEAHGHRRLATSDLRIESGMIVRSLSLNLGGTEDPPGGGIYHS